MPSKNAQRFVALLPNWRTVLSGIMIVAAFPPWGVWPLIFVALIPWLSSLQRISALKALSGGVGFKRRAILEGVWLSFVMSMLGFYWVAWALNRYGGLPWPVSILGLVLYSLGGQPQFAVFAPLVRALSAPARSPAGRRRMLLGIAGLCLVYVTIDWVLPRLFVDTLGHAFVGSRWFRQAADLGGAALLTALVLLTNVVGWLFLSRAPERRTALGLGLTAIALFSGYGIWRSADIERRERAPLKVVNAGVIQANIGDFEKLAAESGVNGAADRVMNTLYAQSEAALSARVRPDFVVWPETAYPSTFRLPQGANDRRREQELAQFQARLGLPILFGGYDQDQGRDFNAFFFLSPKALPELKTDVQVYRKNILLLFGEYIPLSDTFVWIKQMFPQVGNFGRGAGPAALLLGTGGETGSRVKLGPSICYEALFSQYGIETARAGAQALVNITNDSWFGDTPEPHLHLALTVFRSLETRLPMIRATNTGFSALILPSGELAQKSRLFTAETLVMPVPITEPIWTLMKAWGDWFGRASLVISLLLASWYYRAGYIAKPSARTKRGSAA